MSEARDISIDAVSEKDQSGGVRLRLLDSAERLFGEHGVAETSVRAITGAAGLNVALVNYHFGSKENLVRAVVERRQGALNTERLRRLDACHSPTPDSDEILKALAAPALQVAFDHPYFALLASRLRLAPDRSLWRDYRAGQQEVIARFGQALRGVLTHLDEDEVTARVHFVLGGIAHVWAHCPLPPEESPDTLLARFLTFYGAALRAPAPPPLPALFL
ncbi:MAG: TetR/AcrR family transcriptional regulator [Armatimonadota bacterium]